VTVILVRDLMEVDLSTKKNVQRSNSIMKMCAETYVVG
jgi:hypothetical protein